MYDLRRGQPVADPNRMSGTSLPVWLQFCHPNCSGEPLVASHRLAPTSLRDKNLCIVRAKKRFSEVSIRTRVKKRVSIDEEFMPIVFCSLEIHLPHSHSLKEKRSVLRKVVDRLRSRFNFSVSEIEHQELW